MNIRPRRRARIRPSRNNAGHLLWYLILPDGRVKARSPYPDVLVRLVHA